MRLYTNCFESPIGPVVLSCSDRGLIRAEFVDERPAQKDNHRLLDQALTELDEYFRGVRQEFTLPISPSGTEFQRRVWGALLAVRYGHTASYQEVATVLDHAGAARAVGSAVAQNRLAIVVPCHRIVRKDGGSARYAWGSWRREWLLRHEQRALLEYQI